MILLTSNKIYLSYIGTCYHSDHAISRCVVHGIYAEVVDVKCTGWSIPGAGATAAMCMELDEWSPRIFTAHRMMPNLTDISLRPVRMVDGEYDRT